ncbi:MAG: transposase [Lachnospiraceae bacterium]
MQAALTSVVRCGQDPQQHARWLFLKHPEVKQQLWGGHLWNPSYFVSTVSDRTLDQVTQYISSQKTR